MTASIYYSEFLDKITIVGTTKDKGIYNIEYEGGDYLLSEGSTYTIIIKYKYELIGYV